MPIRYWTCHWQNKYWRADINQMHELIGHSAGNSFRKRGVSPGDIVYIVSLMNGQLMLGGKMAVGQILNHKQAVEYLENEYLYEADEHLVAVERSGTPLHLHRQLEPQVTKRLRFQSKDGPKAPFFVSESKLDNQATRGTRELTEESANLLDAIIDITDKLPRSETAIVVGERMLDGIAAGISQPFRFPEEVVEQRFEEGSVKRVEVNRYERDSKARDACISIHGAQCCVCRFDFEEQYGETARGFIHVHHLRPLSECGPGYVPDPREDLVPVCPNCHAVLHLGNLCRSIADVRALLRSPPLQ